jgi:MSHA pilin protein MshC
MSSPFKSNAGNQCGFTLIELVMTLIIVGILSVVVVPKMFVKSVFQSRGLTDQVQASLRFAQKMASAQHRFVCATFTSTSLSLTTGATNTCGTAVASLSGSGNYVINAPSGITITASTTLFSFNSLGQPRTATGADAAIGAVTVSVAGDTTRVITVEAETGYVHQ